MQVSHVGRSCFAVGVDFGGGAPLDKTFHIHVNLLGDVWGRDSLIALINVLNVIGVGKGKLSWE